MSKSKSKLRAQNKALQAQLKEQGSSMDSIPTYISPSGGWDNPDNGFGPSTDPTFGTIFLPPYEFGFNELTNMYQNPLMYRITNLHSGDGTRKGFELVSKDKADEAREMKKEMDSQYNWIALGAKMIAIRHQYGGGCLFADVDDGRDREDPINENGVRKVHSFRPVENWYANPITARPLFGDDKPGQPLHYLVTLQAWGVAETFTCHESRLIRFPSFESDDVISQNERIRRRTWPFSTTQRVYDSIKRYGIGMQSESQLLQGFVEDVFKVKDLKNYKDLAGLRNYVQEQRLLRNSMKATVMGADDSLEKIVTPTTGLKEITADQRRDIGMTSEIPVPILFSEESGALGGSTLDSSREVWNDSIRSKQRNQYTPMYRRMLEIKSYEMRWDLEGIEFEWNPLETMSPKDQAEIENLYSETDKNYVLELGANPADVLDARWGSGKFSTDTPEFDKDEFEKELEEMEALELEQAEKEFEAIQANKNNGFVKEEPKQVVSETSTDEKQPITIVNVPQAGIGEEEFRTLKSQIANIKPADLKPVQDELAKIQETVNTIESKEETKQTFELDFEADE